MAWAERDYDTGGQASSGTNQATISIDVTVGDLIVVTGYTNSASYKPTAVEDTEGNSYSTDIAAMDDAATWYAIANETATINITVTYGESTDFAHRFITAASFNPNGDTISFVTDDTTTYSFATSKETDELSGTQSNVLGIAHFWNGLNKTLDTLEIADTSPDTYQGAYNDYYYQYWSLFTSGVSSESAYASVTASGTLQLHFALFELTSGGGGISIPVVMQQMDQFNGGSFL